jgi:hypothetical protein
MRIPKDVVMGHILKQSPRPLLGVWSLLLEHVWFTPSESPKALTFIFLVSMTMEV